MNLIPVLYENEEILVINKKTGMSVQGGQNIVHSLDEELSKQLGYKVYLVHRLDKDTSGLMVVAKSSFAANKWIKLISSKQVQKEYEAICFNKPNKISGTITDSVLKNGVEKSAVTHFKVIKTFQISQVSVLPQTNASSSAYRVPQKNPKDLSLNQSTSTQISNLETQNPITLSLLHLQLGTGRMHQIRIHLAKNNCPIAFDDQHGNFKLNKLLKKLTSAKTLMLSSVKLTLPIDGSQKTFEIPLPEHFNKLLN